MSLSQVIVPLFTHLIPILFFAYMGMDMLIRDAKRVEHRLVSLTCLCFMMLFVEEYVRQQLPVSYSPALAALWFSSAGILIPGLGFHIFVKLSRLDRKMPRYLYPYVFYLPLIIVFMNLLQIDRVISVNEFYEEGLWKLPVYNEPYYIAMVASIVNNLLYLIPLVKGRASADTKESKGVFNQLIFGVLLSAAWFAAFGLIDFGSSLPPYPYIYGGLLWCFILRHTMRRYDFLDFTDKRFEKLFNLNPAAILLVDRQGIIKEANPSAKQLFASFRLDPNNLWAILDEDVRSLIERQAEIRNHEMTIPCGDKRLDVLIEGDYVLVEHRPHMIFILRDVSLQKENQRKIAHLAYHDPLTGLPNRRYFQERLEEALTRAGSLRQRAAVVLVDLDRFKAINDRYGHQAGDEVLVRTSALIRETIGQDGMSARLGGDEFVFYMERVETLQEVEDRIRSLQQAFAHDGTLGGRETLQVGMSVGIALYPEHGTTVDMLLRHADKAMYEKKRERRNDLRLMAAES